MHIFLSAGEPSGEIHAANLARELKRRIPGVRLTGFGGDRLRDAGVELLYPLLDLSVMWFGRVILNFEKFDALVRLASEHFERERPDAAVLIDYPGLHWWIARRAREQGVPVFSFVPPQIWAWAPWRVNKIKRDFHRVLCSLPFEPDWYRARGFPNAEFVGHPFFDEIGQRSLDESYVAALRAGGGPRLAVLPGSRTQEVERNLPMMLRAAARLAEIRPDVRFHVACLRDRHRELARAIAEKVGVERAVGDATRFHVAKTPEILRAADVAWAVSGSVGLELLAEGLPSVVVYRVNPVDMIVARPFIQSKYISLVNLIADREIFPEYLTTRDVDAELVRHAREWLETPESLERASAAVKELRDRVFRPGAVARAAEAILSDIRREAEPLSPDPASARHPTSA